MASLPRLKAEPLPCARAGPKARLIVEVADDGVGIAEGKPSPDARQRHRHQQRAGEIEGGLRPGLPDEDRQSARKGTCIPFEIPELVTKLPALPWSRSRRTPPRSFARAEASNELLARPRSSHCRSFEPTVFYSYTSQARFSLWRTVRPRIRKSSRVDEHDRAADAKYLSSIL